MKGRSSKQNDGTSSNGNGSGCGGTVEIEKVEVMRSEKPRELDARLEIECLLSRWLVRAYLKKYGGGDDGEAENDIFGEQATPKEILFKEVSL